MTRQTSYSPEVRSRAVRMVPPNVIAEHHITAASADGRPTARAGAAFVVRLRLVAQAALLWRFGPVVARSDTER